MPQLDESSAAIGELQGKLDYLIRYTEGQFNATRDAHTRLSDKIDELDSRMKQTEEYITQQKGIIIAVSSVTGVVTAWAGSVAHKIFGG